MDDRIDKDTFEVLKDRIEIYTRGGIYIFFLNKNLKSYFFEHNFES